MKILHVCLAAVYIDNHSYQENLLPKYHKHLGYDVEIIASLFTFDENGQGTYLKEIRPYKNEYGIPVKRLKHKYGLIGKKLGKYKNTYQTIKKSNPDIIFIHGLQFLDIKYIIRYVLENPKVKIYIDNHADSLNSARNWLSRKILHQKIWKKQAHLIEPYTTKFYGVSPTRVDFLVDMYNISRDKIELLIMGADDEEIDRVNKAEGKSKIREKYGIKPSDFLIVTGGKIDNNKPEVLNLMRAIELVENKSVKLIVFGSVVPELKQAFRKLVDNKKIYYSGWIKSNNSYDYFQSADLVVFPGLHSVFWEQVVGQGIPMLVSNIGNVKNIDLGGNLRILNNSATMEIKKELEKIITNEKIYNKMFNAAQSAERERFLYSEIAKKSIEI